MSEREELVKRLAAAIDAAADHIRLIQVEHSNSSIFAANFILDRLDDIGLSITLAEPAKPPFRVGQVWETRDGEAVRIVAVGMADDTFPIVGIIRSKNGKESATTFTPTGAFSTDGERRDDLIRLIKDVA